MPNIRIGFSSDFTLKNNIVGLGTTTGSGAKLDVDGVSKADYKITGIATLKSYGGFVAQKQHVNEPSTIGFATVGLQTAGVTTTFQYYETEIGFTDLGGVHHGDDQYFNTLSEDLVIDDGQILNITNTEMVGVTTIGEYDRHNHSSYVCAGSLEQVSVTGHFSVPNGGINDRQLTPIEGTVRFNDDLNTLEFFNGVEWRQFTYNQGQSGRGIMFGGRDASGAEIADISYIQVTTRGNAQNFGSLTAGSREAGAACGSAVRSVAQLGQDSAPQLDIEYVTPASLGNGVDFGDLRQRTRGMGSCSSSTRGLFAGGALHPTGNTDDIDYIEISTTGTSLQFGNLATGANRNITSIGNHIKAVFAGGNSDQTLSTVNISSLGDSTEFGAELTAASGHGTVGNSVRGIFAGGYTTANPTQSGIKNADAIIFASLGNPIEFGDLINQTFAFGGMSTQTKGVIGPGHVTFVAGSGTQGNFLEEITISTSGQGVDFGDSGPRVNFAPKVSDSHGGLGGF